MAQHVDTVASSSSSTFDFTAVYIGGWWIMPLGVILVVVALVIVWLAWRRRSRL